MLNIIWGIAAWVIVIAILPLQRLIQLWKVIILSIIWVLLIDFTYIQLGYYEFKPNLSIAGIPLFYLIGSAAGGTLFVSITPRDATYKVLNIFFFSALISVSEQLYIMQGYFWYLNNFTPLLSFTLNVAGLSILMLLSMAIVGEEEIYSGTKSRV